MPFIDTNCPLSNISLNASLFDSPSMTFAHYEFDTGLGVDHQHFHPQEEVYEVIEGELEITIGGITQPLVPGYVGIVPPNTPHAVKAIKWESYRCHFPSHNPPSIRARILRDTAAEDNDVSERGVFCYH